VIDPKLKALTDVVTKELADRGLLMEAGWVSYERLVLSPEAPQIQRDECRIAFFSGAMHLFSSVMSFLDPGHDPTENDMKRMSQLNAELERFLVIFKAKHGLVGKAPYGKNT
jgi:hypothetical protein